MTAPARAAPGQRGAALLVAVLLAAAVSAVVGGVTAFAILDARTSAAEREAARTAAAVEAGLEIAMAALAAEPDLDAVRAGLATAPGSGADAIATLGGVVVDVASLTRGLERARARQPPPWDAGTWRPYAWGRLGELLAAPGGVLPDDPLVVVWVRGAPAGAGAHAGDLDLTIEAVGPQGARAVETASARRGAAGMRLLAVWPEAGTTGS